MKRLTLAALLIFLAGCTSKDATKKTPETATSTSVNTSTTSNTNTNTGPTGSSDPVNPNEIPGAPSEDPELYPTLPPGPVVKPGTVVSHCGTLYSKFNQENHILAVDTSTDLFEIKGDEYDATLALGRVKFPNDSYEVCLDGRLQANSSLILVDQITVMDAIANPERPQDDLFTFKFCGVVSNHTEPNGTQYLQVKDNVISYIINNTLEVVFPSLANQSNVKGCIYSNTDFFYDYSASFKRQIEVEDYDLGTLNIIVMP